MVKSEQITIGEKELPELKRWLKEKNKKISKMIKLRGKGIRVMVENN